MAFLKHAPSFERFLPNPFLVDASVVDRATLLGAYVSFLYDVHGRRDEQVRASLYQLKGNWITASRTEEFFGVVPDQELKRLVKSTKRNRAETALFLEEKRGRQKFPLSIEMVIEARRDLWEPCFRNVSRPGLDNAGGYLAFATGFDFGARPANVIPIPQEKGKVPDRCMQPEDFRFLVGVGEQREDLTYEKYLQFKGHQLAAYLTRGLRNPRDLKSKALLRRIATVTEAYVDLLISKVGTVPDRYIGRRTWIESQYLDDMIKWIIVSEVEEGQPFFGRWWQESPTSQRRFKAITPRIVTAAIKRGAVLVGLGAYTKHFTGRSCRSGMNENVSRCGPESTEVDYAVVARERANWKGPEHDKKKRRRTTQEAHYSIIRQKLDESIGPFGLYGKSSMSTELLAKALPKLICSEEEALSYLKKREDQAVEEESEEEEAEEKTSGEKRDDKVEESIVEEGPARTGTKERKPPKSRVVQKEPVYEKEGPMGFPVGSPVALAWDIQTLVFSNFINQHLSYCSGIDGVGKMRKKLKQFNRWFKRDNIATRMRGAAKEAEQWMLVRFDELYFNQLRTFDPGPSNQSKEYVDVITKAFDFEDKFELHSALLRVWKLEEDKEEFTSPVTFEVIAALMTPQEMKEIGLTEEVNGNFSYSTKWTLEQLNYDGWFATESGVTQYLRNEKVFIHDAAISMLREEEINEKARPPEHKHDRQSLPSTVVAGDKKSIEVESSVGGNDLNTSNNQECSNATEVDERMSEEDESEENTGTPFRPYESEFFSKRYGKRNAKSRVYTERIKKRGCKRR